MSPPPSSTLSALPHGEEKRAVVRAMFDRIAPRYDLVNRLMTGGLDRRWRSAAVDAIGIGPDDTVLDLACGTGDLLALCTARGARALGVDFAHEMLAHGRRRARAAPRVQGDAARLPLRDGAVSALVCGFALRNFVSLDDAFAEMARVVSPGGRIALLDAGRPRGRLLRAGHGFYFDRVVPRIGALLSDRAAYAYLPLSTAYLPSDERLHEKLRAAGFADPHSTRFLFGSAQLIVAHRSGAAAR